MPAIPAPIDWEISPYEYQSSAAATRISRTNSLGDRRNADSALSGTSNVMLAIIPAVADRIPAACCEKTVGVRTLKRGATAPREVLPIVNRLSAGD